MDYSIFLVEDSASDVYLLQEALTSSGVEFRMEVHDCGDAALRELWNRARQGGNPPNLIVLDINVPRVCGLTMLEAIRSLEFYNKVRVAMVTSSGAESDRSRAMELGADLYLVKPCSYQALMDLGLQLKRLIATAA